MGFGKTRIAKARSRREFLAEMERERRLQAPERRAEVAPDDTETPVSPTQPNFEGDPGHLAKLKEGVEAWNKWRKENPDIEPSLQGVDFTRAEDFQGTPIWGTPNWDKTGPDRILLGSINLSGANLTGANLSGAALTVADLSGAFLLRIDLHSADLQIANLSGADLFMADLRCAHLWRTNFSGVDFWRADLRGADLSTTNLTNANVTGVQYTRKLLRNRCHGIRAEACYGNAQFKRDVIDQDYLDQVENRIREGVGGYPETVLEKVKWWAVAAVNGFGKWGRLIAGAGLGVLFALVLLHHVSASNGRLDGIPETIFAASHWPVLAEFSLIGLVIAGFFSGTAGKLLMFKLWGWFDFGRSWAAVLVFAALTIFLFGLGYYLWDGSHIVLTGEAHSHPVWFFPWFVALMGFATLGIANYAIPLDSLGALLMMANVLSGFLTLGLLLSVLGNIFARRA